MAERISIMRSLFNGKEMWACANPKTESFRMASASFHRNTNSVYADLDTVSESSNGFESDSSAASTSEISSSDDCCDMPEFMVEDLVRGLCSERFFFEANCTKSIVEDSKQKINEFHLMPFTNARSGLERGIDEGLPLRNENEKTDKARGFERENSVLGEKFPFKENLNGRVTAGFNWPGKYPGGGNNDEERTGDRDEMHFGESKIMLLDSDDPYRDFMVSMEEMVEAYELYDWDSLEEMLVWYLGMNSKNAYGHIVGAFVDLLLALNIPSSWPCPE